MRIEHNACTVAYFDARDLSRDMIPKYVERRLDISLAMDKPFIITEDWPIVV